jgi:hypothetical protein
MYQYISIAWCSIKHGDKTATLSVTVNHSTTIILSVPHVILKGLLLDAKKSYFFQTYDTQDT